MLSNIFNNCLTLKVVNAISLQQVSMKVLNSMHTPSPKAHRNVIGYLNDNYKHIIILEGMENIFPPIYFAFFAPKLTFLPHLFLTFFLQVFLLVFTTWNTTEITVTITMISESPLQRLPSRPTKPE